MASHAVEVELNRRYATSAQPESQQVMAVLSTVKEVIQAQGLQTTPTSLFAAVMSALERQAVQEAAPDAVAALCTILAVALPFVPQAVLRAKGSTGLSILQQLLAVDDISASNVASRSAITCIGELLGTTTITDWPSSTRAFELQVAHFTDVRPKVRKAAVASVLGVLRSLRGTPTIELAASLLTRAAERVLEAPGRAASMNTEELPGAITAALHFLGALQTVLPALPVSQAVACVEQVKVLFPLGQPLLTAHAADVLVALCTVQDDLSAATLASLLLSLLDAPVRKQEAATVQAVSRVVQTGFQRLYALNRAVCCKHLPRAFFYFLPSLRTTQEESLVTAVCESLKELVRVCIDVPMIAEAVKKPVGSQQGAPGEPALVRICTAVKSALGGRFEHSWGGTLIVVDALIQKLGLATSVIMHDTLEALGNMAEAPSLACRQQLHATIGVALRFAGPEAVLAAISLNLERALAVPSASLDPDDADFVAGSNAWLLPVMRQEVRGCTLATFTTKVLPLAKRMAVVAVAAKASGKSAEAQRALQLEFQLWATLPAFANWPTDLSTAFSGLAKDLGEHLAARPDLRGLICTTLKQLIQANCDVRDEQTESDPSYSKEEASANLAALGAFSRNFLPLFFNLYVTLGPEQRSVIGECISAYVEVTEPSAATSFFRTIMAKLAKVTMADGGPAQEPLLEGGETSAERRSTFMDLASMFSKKLDASSLGIFVKVLEPAVFDADGGVQKTAYKSLANLCETQNAFARSHLPQLLDLLQTALPSCASSSKRNRLKFAGSLLRFLAEDDDPKAQTALSTAISEVVLCTKETNQKTRTQAYDLLRDLAYRLESSREQADPWAVKGGGVRILLDLLLGGLASPQAHMVSATIMSLSRILYEFPAQLGDVAPKLLPAVLLLLRTKNREVVKAVLGFVKVAVAKLQRGELLPHLGVLLPGLFSWSDDPKNRFRLKVRMVMERLVQRLGYDAVSKELPQEHARLLHHIRKEENRREHRSRMHANGGDMANDVNDDGRATTVGNGQWHGEDIFSEDEDEDGGGSRAQAKSRKSVKAQSHGRQQREGFRPSILEKGDDDDPLDLLNTAAGYRQAREIMRTRSGNLPAGEGDFAMADDGRMVIKDDKTEQKRKRDRDQGDGEVSDAGDAGEEARSEGGASRKSGRSRGPTIASNGHGKKIARGGPHAGVHSGNVYKSAKGAGGDVKRGNSGLEPFAYWALDKSLMNRRTGKKAEARRGLRDIVKKKR